MPLTEQQRIAIQCYQEKFQTRCFPIYKTGNRIIFVEKYFSGSCGFVRFGQYNDIHNVVTPESLPYFQWKDGCSFEQNCQAAVEYIEKNRAKLKIGKGSPIKQSQEEPAIGTSFVTSTSTISPTCTSPSCQFFSPPTERSVFNTIAAFLALAAATLAVMAAFSLIGGPVGIGVGILFVAAATTYVTGVARTPTPSMTL